MRTLTIILMVSLAITATLSLVSGNYNDARMDLIFLNLLIINEKIEYKKN